MGARAFGLIEGEWAAVVIDAHSDTIVFGRDYPGVRQLYYVTADTYIVWSTDLGALAECGWSQVSMEYLSSFIDGTVWPSPYEGVIALKPGEYISVANGKVVGREINDPSRSITGVTGSVRELAEEFGHLLRLSIEKRVFADARWRCALELSGGFDSSSIVAVANRICTDNRTDPSRIITLTYGSSDASRQEELSCARLVSGRVPFRNISFSDDRVSLLGPVGRRRRGALPDGDWGRNQAVAAVCRQERIARLVTGHGGDAIAWEERRPYVLLADLLSRRRLSALWSELGLAATVFQETIWTLLWHDAIALALRLRGWNWRIRGNVDPAVPWLLVAPPAIERAHGSELPSVTLLHRRFESLSRGLSHLAHDALSPTVLTHPYLDISLIRFAYAVGYGVKVTPYESRRLQRVALAGMLPDELLGRRQRAGGGGADTWIRHLESSDGLVESALDSNSILAQRRVINVERARQAWRAIVSGRDRRYLTALWRTLTLELWLRSEEGMSPFAEN
jgi:hypothetical protein